jgi:hypothetical protein
MAMGSPTSAILAEILVCIQHMEHNQIYPIRIKPIIIEYYRYVDDIPIIYDQKKTNIAKTLIEINKKQINIKFVIEKK